MEGGSCRQAIESDSINAKQTERSKNAHKNAYHLPLKRKPDFLRKALLSSSLPTPFFSCFSKNIVESSKVFGQKVYVVFKSLKKNRSLRSEKETLFFTEVVTRNIDNEVGTLIVEDYQ